MKYFGGISIALLVVSVGCSSRAIYRSLINITPYPPSPEKTFELQVKEDASPVSPIEPFRLRTMYGGYDHSSNLIKSTFGYGVRLKGKRDHTGIDFVAPIGV